MRCGFLASTRAACYIFPGKASAVETTDNQPRLSFSQPAADSLLMRLSGPWTIEEGLPSADEVAKHLEPAPQIRRVAFDTQALTHWDSSLLTFLLKVGEACSRRNTVLDEEGLPPGARRLLALASEVPEREGARKEETHERFFTRVGRGTLETIESTRETLAFIGEATLALLRFLAGKASFRRSDLTLIIQECGAQALPDARLLYCGQGRQARRGIIYKDIFYNLLY